MFRINLTVTSYKLFGLASRWHKDLALVTATLAILISINGMSLIYVAYLVTSFIAPHASYQNDDNLTSTYEGLNFVFNNRETVEIDLLKAPNTEELYWSVFMLNGDRVFLDLTNMSVIAENLWIAGLTDFLSELHSIRFLGCTGQPFLLLFGLVMSLIFLLAYLSGGPLEHNLPSTWRLAIYLEIYLQNFIRKILALLYSLCC